MAEVIGVVASGITIGALAAQITSSVIKIKRFWEQIQNAPEEVQDLIEELEILNNILTDIEDGQRQNPMSSLIWDPKSTSRCLEYCKQAAERLKDLTEALSVELEARKKMPRKWASVKVVLKKDKIDSYRGKLERAVRLLTLSQQLYTRTLLQLQPEIIVAKLRPSIVPPTDLESEPPGNSQSLSPPESRLTTGTATSKTSDLCWNLPQVFGKLLYTRRCYWVRKGKAHDDTGRKQEIEVMTAQYRAPSWLVHKIWSVQAIKASCGWDYRLRTCNIVDMHSIVFEYARTNNVEGVQELFRRGDASPSDCNQFGETVLMHAARKGSYDTCDLLINEGADSNFLLCVGERCLTALELALLSSSKDSETLPRRLLNETELTPSWLAFRGSAKEFILWQEALDPFYYQRPLKERFEIASAVALDNGPEVFKTALSRDLNAHFLFRKYSETLHAVAKSIGWSILGEMLPSASYQLSVNLEGWLRILRDLRATGLDIHDISTESRTPFLDLFLGQTYRTGFREACKCLLLDTWLEALQVCGVDLVEYGRKETQLHEQKRVLRVWENSGLRRDYSCEQTTWVMTSFTYGPSPSDWTVNIEQLYNSVAEDSGSMPGGWVDDDDSAVEGSGSEWDVDEDYEEVEYLSAHE